MILVDITVTWPDGRTIAARDAAETEQEVIAALDRARDLVLVRLKVGNGGGVDTDA